MGNLNNLKTLEIIISLLKKYKINLNHILNSV
jgi:hypothetical protein